jgi:hypothetical protein
MRLVLYNIRVGGGVGFGHTAYCCVFVVQVDHDAGITFDSPVVVVPITFNFYFDAYYIFSKAYEYR